MWLKSASSRKDLASKCSGCIMLTRQPGPDPEMSFPGALTAEVLNRAAKARGGEYEMGVEPLSH